MLSKMTRPTRNIMQDLSKNLSRFFNAPYMIPANLEDSCKNLTRTFLQVLVRSYLSSVMDLSASIAKLSTIAVM